MKKQKDLGVSRSEDLANQSGIESASEQEDTEEDPSESGNEQEDEPEGESGEELEEEQEDKPRDELEDDPEEDPSEESEEEQEENMEEEPDEQVEEDAEEELSQELEEALQEEPSECTSGSLPSNSNEHVNENTSKQKEGTGNSVKQRRSRWDPLPQGGKETVEDNQGSKRRKTRWSDQPAFMSKIVAGIDLGPEIYKLQAELSEIDHKLQKPELQDDRPEEERSPSPEPLYNNLGIRINTREVRQRQKLVQKRKHIMSKLTKKFSFNPRSGCKLIKKSVYDSPSGCMPSKFFKKLHIPVKEYPEYNFVGLILGPRGHTQKKMEKETGAKILLRGKGSSLTHQNLASDNEELHVYIEADNQHSLDAAVQMVEKLLIPVDEGMNEHKRAQLTELAKLRGTYNNPNTCRVCGEEGHKQYACPRLQSTFIVPVSCNKCGSNSHTTATCLQKSSSPHSIPNNGHKPKNEISDANLYVGYLPKVVDDIRLKELFSPFGKLTEAKVIKDRTTGLSKCYGFVKFENPTDAAAAVKLMNGYKMDGKMLAVRIAGHNPGTVTSVLSNLPQYPGPAAISQTLPSPTGWPGPPGSLIPEPQASFPLSRGASLHSTLAYRGHGELLPKSEPSCFTHSVSSLSNLHSGSSALHSSYKFSNQIPFTSPASTVQAAQFPGDPDYPGSVFQSYFSTPTIKPSPPLLPGQVPDSNLNCNFFRQ